MAHTIGNGLYGREIDRSVGADRNTGGRGQCGQDALIDKANAVVREVILFDNGGGERDRAVRISFGRVVGPDHQRYGTERR